jgi:FlaA1/EpsC-like NDP-sugar epimerase
VFTGLRPGEKMHEELTGDGERFVETEHAKVRRVIAESESSIDLNALMIWLNQPSPQDVRAELKRWVIDFNPPVAPTVEHRHLLAQKA